MFSNVFQKETLSIAGSTFIGQTPFLSPAPEHPNTEGSINILVQIVNIYLIPPEDSQRAYSHQTAAAQWLMQWKFHLATSTDLLPAT